MTTVRLPLFPLNSVLFPGLVLPLNVFEERYRAMARDLTAARPGATMRERHDEMLSHGSPAARHLRTLLAL